MVTLAFKVSEEEEAFVRQQAEARRTTVSGVLRGAIAGMRKKQGRARILLKRHPVSGCLYNAAPPLRVPTQEELQEATKDYL